MKLEDRIRGIRDKLDIEQPDEDYIWKGISQNLNKKKSAFQFSVWKVAVAAMLIFAVSYSIISNQVQRRNSQLILVKFDSELAKEEAQILKTIDLYYDELNKSVYEESSLVTHFSDLEQIDTLIAIYATDLDTRGPDPRILNNLMDLYQKKVRVLNRMLNEIEKNKRYEKNTTHI